MTKTVLRADGSLVEIPPAVLACGCPYMPGRVRVGYWPHPSGAGRARAYHCAVHRVDTWCEPDNGRGAALGR